MDEEEEVFDDEEEGDYDEEEQEMDETMDDVNGDVVSETGSAFPASERSLKSVVNFSSRAQGLFFVILFGQLAWLTIRRFP